MLDPVSRKIRATALARAGYISRAAKALSQDGLQPASADVVDKLRVLHPPSAGSPPPCPDIVTHVGVDYEVLAKIISKKLKNGSAPGPSGWTGELIDPLVDDPDCLDGLGVLVGDILNGDLDDNSRVQRRTAVSVRLRYRNLSTSSPP